MLLYSYNAFCSSYLLPPTSAGPSAVRNVYVIFLSRELTEPAGQPADARKMKSAGRRGNIGPSAGLVILELTEPADRPAVVRPMLRFFEHTQPADFII